VFVQFVLVAVVEVEHLVLMLLLVVAAVVLVGKIILK
jgi:hypothetical protein